jgi:hypothetical protein
MASDTEFEPQQDFYDGASVFGDLRGFDDAGTARYTDVAA